MRTSPRVVLAAAAAIVAAAMAVFAVQIERSQSTAHEDAEERVRERAQVSAALTESIFTTSSSSAQAENVRRFGGDDGLEQRLEMQVREGSLAYAVLLGPVGEVVAASPSAPERALEALRREPVHVRRVRDGSPFALSDEQTTPAGARGTLEYAQPVPMPSGMRVLVSGFPPELIHAFLGGYLGRVPNSEGGNAYIVDGNGVVVGSAAREISPTLQPADEGLRAALGGAAEGAFRGDRYFTSSEVGNSSWRVVVTAPESTLFASVRGTRKWIPWLLLCGFGLAAGGVLVLIRRVLVGAERLSVANTRLETANDALERRARELERSNAELEQFASIASHDLREPLRKVQMFAAQLEDKEGDRLSDDGHDYLRRMSRAGERMQLLIDDLLKFSRVATHAQPFAEVDLREVARACVDDLEAVVAESGAVVHVGGLPTVSADEAQMRQLLQNLISNALKFRREGVAPEVWVDGRTRGRFAEVTVRDNGIGFDPRYASRIFRIFERLHGRDAYPGTGVGLALCRKIAERHGGAITADSTPGEGSAFTVSIPLRHEAPATEESRRPPAHDEQEAPYAAA